MIPRWLKVAAARRDEVLCGQLGTPNRVRRTCCLSQTRDLGLQGKQGKDAVPARWSLETCFGQSVSAPEASAIADAGCEKGRSIWLGSSVIFDTIQADRRAASGLGGAVCASV